MILTITLILSFLVAINFLLLVFSSNKTPKKIKTRRPHIIRNEKPTLVSSQSQTRRLAATGS